MFFRILSFLAKQEAVGTSIALDSRSQKDEDEKLAKDEEDENAQGNPKVNVIFHPEMQWFLSVSKLQRISLKILEECSVKSLTLP